MDPVETFHAMIEAQSLGEYREADERALALVEWLNKGGVPPPLVISALGKGPFQVVGDLSRSFCYAACRFVLDQHEAGCDVASEPPIEIGVGDEAVFDLKGAEVVGRIEELNREFNVAVIFCQSLNVSLSIGVGELRPLLRGRLSSSRRNDEPDLP